MNWHIIEGDCLAVMGGMEENSMDSIVTDPPYGLSFMGKAWDHGVPGVPFWQAALRVARPGAHLLAFGGTRTFHRLAVAIEDAGWELRDTIGWLYGSGFPKSHDVSKAIDKASGAEREVVGKNQYANRRPSEAGSPAGCYGDGIRSPETTNITAPATDAARQWDGWGTALKPAWEPIVVARKPFPGTVAQNVLAHGCGGINVDGCRVGTGGGTTKGNPPKESSNGIYGNGINGACDILDIGKGRWPANLIHDGSEEVVGLFPHSTGFGGSHGGSDPGMWSGKKRAEIKRHNDSGSAARFFYCAKCSRRDRNEGLPEGTKNTHPCLKPTDLMRYLCRLVTPPNGIILDPFMGSGSTGKGALREGFRFVGIDKDPESCTIARARLAYEQEGKLPICC